MDDFYTTRQAAAYVGIPPYTLRRLNNKGFIKAYRMYKGAWRRFRKLELDALKYYLDKDDHGKKYRNDRAA